MIIAGIDPDKKGAICVIDTGGLLETELHDVGYGSTRERKIETVE